MTIYKLEFLFGLGILLVVFLIVFSPMSFHVVDAGHRGVVVKLGKVDPDFIGEGFVLKLPITKIKEISIQQETATTDCNTFSSDLQTVTMKCNILYKIPETKVVKLFQQFRGAPYVSLVEPRLNECIKQVSALHKAEDIVKKREHIKADVLERIRVSLLDEDGTALIQIVDVVIANVDLTDELEKAIELKQVMEQSALAKNYELQKEQKEAEIVLVKAKAEAEAIKIKGETLKSSPEVIQLEIAKRWDGKAPLSVSTIAGGANILLPLK